MLKGMIALWQAMGWLLSLKKELEYRGTSYFTRERALEWRLNCEKIAHSLETGNTEKLPGPVKWLFARTTLDNRIGVFFIFLLKSKKLGENDKELDQPLNRPH